MKQIFLSVVVGGLTMAMAAVMTGSVMAADLPSADLKDQLKSEITQNAANKVAAGLNPDPTPTPTPLPLVINTGDDVAVDTSQSQSEDTTVSNENQAAVNQGGSVQANTGGNTANYNISIGGNAGMITTGDAHVYNQLEAAANTNKTGVHSNCPAVTGGGQLVNSGNDVNVNGGSSANCSTTITNGNGAVINQAMDSQANTGDNQAKGNISIGGSAGQIVTGNASVGSMLVARANSNVVLVGGTGGNGGPGNGANIYIINTGDDATIADRRSVANSSTVTNLNLAAINQVAELQANTGGNTANGNININGDAGVIRTGDAIVHTTMSAEANRNQTTVAHGNGQVGGSQTDISNTGSDLDVDASTDVNSEVEVTNINIAEVNQGVNASANTGNNKANGNIAINGNAGIIVTGNAVVTTKLDTDVNENQTLVAGGNAGAVQGNSLDLVNTGNDVEVDSSVEVNSDIEVTNTNIADVNQVVTAEANTGDNVANGNIGNSSISTGDVNITTEVITNANNNYTFIIDSEVTGFELFKQFVETFLGMTWDELVVGGGAGGGFVANAGNTALPGQNTSIVNSGDNVTILNEQTHNRQVVVNNSNHANVNQAVYANANTGGNSCVGNIGDCQITTGDATIWNRLVANLNNNFTFIGNVTLPEVPVEPEPETPTEPETETPSEPEVEGETVERPGIVLAAALPNTGGESAGAFGFGLLLLGLGAVLKRKA